MLYLTFTLIILGNNQIYSINPMLFILVFFIVNNVAINLPNAGLRFRFASAGTFSSDSIYSPMISYVKFRFGN